MFGQIVVPQISNWIQFGGLTVILFYMAYMRKLDKEERRVIKRSVDIAGVRARKAVVAAEKAAETGVLTAKGQAENANAISVVHDAVNGGMAAQKKEIIELKSEISFFKREISRLQEVISINSGNEKHLGETGPSVVQ